MHMSPSDRYYFFFFFFQAEDGIRDKLVTGVQTCALPIFNDLRAAVHLLPGYGERAFVVPAQDQLGKRGRAGDVGPFPDVYEVRVRADGHRLEAAQARIQLDGRRDMRRPIPDSLGNCLDVGWRGPATPAHDVEPASLRELPEIGRHDLGRLVAAPEGVRQPGVRVTANKHRRDARQLFEVRPHLLRAEP